MNLAINQNEGADALRVISSETAQEILAALSAEPHTASSLAEHINASVQNVMYHVKRLDDAGVITPVQTWYSEKGREMTVYGISSEKLVIEIDSFEDDTTATQSA